MSNPGKSSDDDEHAKSVQNHEKLKTFNPVEQEAILERALVLEANYQYDPVEGPKSPVDHLAAALKEIEEEPWRIQGIMALEIWFICTCRAVLQPVFVEEREEKKSR